LAQQSFKMMLALDAVAKDVDGGAEGGFSFSHG
jgi:hypothetical protein